MNKKIISIVGIVIFIISFIIGFWWGGSMVTVEAKPYLWKAEEEFNVRKIHQFEDIHIGLYTLEELENKINEQKVIQNHAHELAERARALGWPEDSETIEFAKNEWMNAQMVLKIYEAEYNEKYEKSFAKQMKEYPEATETWIYMKSLGWNDYVCAGIMGNLMAETGGQTLKLNPSIYEGSYYGICQWGPGYKEIWDSNLKQQLDFLKDTIKYEFDTYGNKYQNSFNFDTFLSIKDEKEAAMAFAKCYERCASKSYEVRKNNATTAYNYFVK